MSYLNGIYNNKKELLESDIYKLIYYETFYNFDKVIDYIKKYKDDILFSIKNSDNNNLYGFREYLYKMKVNRTFDDIIYQINKKIEEKPEIYIKNLIDNIIDKEIDTLRDIVFLIIKEIVEEENVNYIDINKIDKGHYSEVLQIGNKVIKIGSKRETFRIDKIPYILQPLLRREFKSNDTIICVEVTEVVDTKSVTEKDVYEMYKKMRELGYIWTDARIENIGRLLKDNVIHFNKNLQPSDEILNFNSTNNTTVLKKGEIVILDSDYIYNEKNQNINWLLNSKKYEERYQEELNHKNKLK